MLFAEELLIPDAQHVITGLSFFILARLADNICNGILTEPLDLKFDLHIEIENVLTIFVCLRS